MKIVDANHKEYPDASEPFQLVLTLDRKTLHLDISGNCGDLDIALNMISTANRYFDAQYRIAAGLQAQSAANQAKRDLEFAMNNLRKQ